MQIHAYIQSLSEKKIVFYSSRLLPALCYGAFIIFIFKLHIHLTKTTETCIHGWKGFCNCCSIPLTIINISDVLILWGFSWDCKTSDYWLQLSTYQMFHQQVFIPGHSFCIWPHKPHCWTESCFSFDLQ